MVQPLPQTLSITYYVLIGSVCVQRAKRSLCLCHRWKQELGNHLRAQPSLRPTAPFGGSEGHSGSFGAEEEEEEEEAAVPSLFPPPFAFLPPTPRLCNSERRGRRHRPEPGTGEREGGEEGRREAAREGGREEGRRQLPPAPRLRGPRRRGCGSRRAPRGCNRPQPPPAAPEPMGCARRLLGGEYSSGNPPPGYPPLPDPPPRAPQRADPLRFLYPSISGRFSASFSLPFSPEPLMRALPPARIACRRGGLRGICRAVIKLFSLPPLARMK